MVVAMSVVSVYHYKNNINKDQNHFQKIVYS